MCSCARPSEQSSARARACVRACVRAHGGKDFGSCRISAAEQPHETRPIRSSRASRSSYLNRVRPEPLVRQSVSRPTYPEVLPYARGQPVRAYPASRALLSGTARLHRRNVPGRSVPVQMCRCDTGEPQSKCRRGRPCGSNASQRQKRKPKAKAKSESISKRQQAESTAGRAALRTSRRRLRQSRRAAGRRTAHAALPRTCGAAGAPSPAGQPQLAAIAALPAGTVSRLWAMPLAEARLPAGSAAVAHTIAWAAGADGTGLPRAVPVACCRAYGARVLSGDRAATGRARALTDLQHDAVRVEPLQADCPPRHLRASAAAAARERSCCLAPRPPPRWRR